MRDPTTACDRKVAKRLGNVQTVIDAVSILSRTRSATIKRSGSGFTHQRTANDDTVSASRVGKTACRTWRWLAWHPGLPREARPVSNANLSVVAI
jgi:hypothetical protein